eukprot:CAMPEP_0177635144 /NCGR_PEP_ID=MMETSP0447-20121125/3746_1 /TAXON_ID=0 /ORGANISM="Stygamoeba regulata, Strain BSH-02190019" /LENGTH=588 /DNA_ID=CAMNT_0019136915 /DNA_START=44 /DNA_END=1810 /DNA_ORIENTATION=+
MVGTSSVHTSQSPSLSSGDRLDDQRPSTAQSVSASLTAALRFVGRTLLALWRIVLLLLALVHKGRQDAQSTAVAFRYLSLWFRNTRMRMWQNLLTFLRSDEALALLRNERLKTQPTRLLTSSETDAEEQHMAGYSCDLMRHGHLRSMGDLLRWYRELDDEESESDEESEMVTSDSLGALGGVQSSLEVLDHTLVDSPSANGRPRSRSRTQSQGLSRTRSRSRSLTGMRGLHHSAEKGALRCSSPAANPAILHTPSAFASAATSSSVPSRTALASSPELLACIYVNNSVVVRADWQTARAFPCSERQLRRLSFCVLNPENFIISLYHMDVLDRAFIKEHHCEALRKLRAGMHVCSVLPAEDFFPIELVYRLLCVGVFTMGPPCMTPQTILLRETGATFLEHEGFVVLHNLIPPAHIANLRELYKTKYERNIGDRAGMHAFQWGDRTAIHWNNQMVPLVSSLMRTQLRATLPLIHWYTPGSSLDLHVDGADKYPFSLSVALEQRGQVPLRFISQNSTETVISVSLGLGDGVFFKGQEHPHWRDTLTEEQYLLSLSFSFSYPETGRMPFVPPLYQEVGLAETTTSVIRQIF